MGKNEDEGKRYELKNAFEDTVRITVRNYVDKDPDMCKCEKCYLDVCALVLNSGFTKFVTTEKGSLLTELDRMAEGGSVSLLVEILRAIEVVKKAPSHQRSSIV